MKVLGDSKISGLECSLIWLGGTKSKLSNKSETFAVSHEDVERTRMLQLTVVVVD